MKTYQLFIDGEFVDPVSGQWIDTVDPYRGEAWAQIPRGNAKDIDRAVAAAARAMRQSTWTDMTATARGKLMRRLGDLIAREAERLADIEVRDNGKLKQEMLGQLRYHSEWWWYYGGLADKLEGAVPPIDKPEIFAFTRHEPIGVVGALTAWNSPLLFVAFKCAPAIAAGCAVVVKPSEFASASTLVSRPASSTWSPATEQKPAVRWSNTPTSPRSRSQDPIRRAQKFTQQRLKP
jgi:acyl-CoA reductase-like NAD-dependent aldehyde dehydrogenase